jgi:hypothetical protein
MRLEVPARTADEARWLVIGQSIIKVWIAERLEHDSTAA